MSESGFSEWSFQLAYEQEGPGWNSNFSVTPAALSNVEDFSSFRRGAEVTRFAELLELIGCEWFGVGRQESEAQIRFQGATSDHLIVFDFKSIQDKFSQM